ncbi:MAG: hypothetical protein NTV05_17910 [Acidobacteria bacterium]|nr:hypothetical protein [Acidobacteriota bacterium]
MRRLFGVIVVFVFVLAPAAPLLRAASRTDTMSVSATVAARAKLTLSYASMAFPDADPDAVPLVPAGGGALIITAKARTTPGSTVTLVVLASDDLRSGLDTIPAGNLTWTATGGGFSGGTMNKTTAQTVGSWANSGFWSGTQSYALVNSWNFSTGTYTTTLNYTLTAP